MEIRLNDVLDADLDAFYRENPECGHIFLMEERNIIFSSASPEADLVDANTYALFMEMLTPRLGFDRDDHSHKKYYDYICEQIYRFFTSKDYLEDRYTAMMVKEMLITTVALQIVQQTGWNAALVAALITLVLSSVVKIGIRAWCQYYEDRHPEVK